MNVIGPCLRPVVAIKKLTLDDIEVIKVNLKAKHEIPEIKYSPPSIPPKLNEESQQSQGRSRSLEKVEMWWRSNSEEGSTKFADSHQKWEHQLQIQGISSLFPDSQTLWKPPPCDSPSLSTILGGDVSVKEEKEEMDVEDHLIHVDDCASLSEFSLDPPESTECFVQSEYPCYKCDMVFSKSDLLLHHLKIHRTSQSSCTVSSQRRSSLFSPSTPLRRSASNCLDLLRSKNLKYKCRNCGRGFSRSNYLELHVRAFFRNRTCDKIAFSQKKYKTPSQVQIKQKIGSGFSSNLLVSDHKTHNPVEDQNFVRAMMMHVAATAEDCFNRSKSEHHEDKVNNSRQTGKETTVSENMVRSICKGSGSTIGNAQEVSAVSGRKGACETPIVNDIFQNSSGIVANLGPQSSRIGGRIICSICSRRFKRFNHLKLHYRAHYKIHNTTEKGNLMSTILTNNGCPLLESEIPNVSEKGNFMSANSTNKVPSLLESNNQSVFPSACQTCGKLYKDTYLLKEHDMTHSLEASGVSNCSSTASEDTICNFILLENLTDACEGGSSMFGNSTGPKEQPLECEKKEKESCSEVREESTLLSSISKQNVPSGDVPSNAKEPDVSQSLPLCSSNTKELSCYVSLEKLELVTKTAVADDLKIVVKYGKESHVKESTVSENNVKKTRTSSKVSNNNEGSSESYVIYGRTRQTSRNISYSETRPYCRKVNAENSESFESSIVSSPSGYKKRYRCRMCMRKVFTQRKDYEQHRMLECIAPVISCPLCGATFHKKFLLVAHMSRHFKSWNGVCTFILNRAVSGAFPKNENKNSARKSSSVTRSETNSVLQHDVTSKKNSGEVLPHLRQKQKKPLRVSSQKLDQNMLKYSGKLVRRKLKHRTNSLVRKLENLRVRNSKTARLAGKTVKCVACDKSFGSLKALKLHKRVHARTVHQCFVCGKEFDSVLDLRMHVRVHYKRVKVCNLCGEDFPNLSSLLSHRSVHKKP